VDADLVSTLQTADLGTIEYTERDVFVFRSGIPGFDSRTRFLLVKRVETAPFCYLRSTEPDGPRFICLPLAVVDPTRSIELSEEDAQHLDLPAGVYDQNSEGLLMLVIVTLPAGGEPTVNLLAPVVLALGPRLGHQSVQATPQWRTDHLLRQLGGRSAC
jgi:flagellar assembly factor FliW